MSGDTLSINEIFFSIQGESTRIGEPCVFIRLAGCDLRCRWCDTEYAFTEGRRLAIEKIIEDVRVFPTDLVEVTGGEPLLQSGVHELIHRLLSLGKTVLIETGGHRDIRQVDPAAILVYDIKCPDSGMSEHNRWENLDHLRVHDEIKFVIASRQDYEWARQVVRDRGLASIHPVLFSPVWDSLSPRDLAEWILEDGLPVRMQVQLHKVLWGPDARGI
jgi:7-carboxy-7-deazaguanine synthase